MKTAFVFSGGGAKGCFQLGVLQRLLETGIKPDAVYGTSAGALNAAAFAFSGIDGLTTIWKSINGTGDILDANFWKPWAIPGMTGLYSTDPLRDKVNSVIIGKDPAMEAAVCYVDLLNGSMNMAYASKCSREDFAKFTLASASIPLIMEPVDDHLADGGVRQQTPLMPAITDGADVIYAILCNPYEDAPDKWDGAGFPKFIGNGVRAVDIIEHQLFLDDIEKCMQYNQIPGKRVVDLRVIAPKAVFMDTLDFSAESIEKGIALGRAAL